MRKKLIVIAILFLLYALISIFYVWPKERQAEEISMRVEKLAREEEILKSDYGDITVVEDTK